MGAAGAAAGVMAAGTVVSAYSQYKAGQEQKRAANLQADLMDQSADDLVNRTTGVAADIRRQGQRVMGTQKVAMAGSGVEIGSGTSAKILQDTAGISEVEALTVMDNALREAYGMKTQASMTRKTGQVAASAGNLNAFGSLLAGGGQAYYSYKNVNRGAVTPSSPNVGLERGLR